MANTAEADVCNLALARIGQLKQITSLDTTVDTSPNAARCAFLYPRVRDRMLSRARWRWATRVAVLAPDAQLYPDAAQALPGWEHAYLDPADLLEPHYIFDGVRPTASGVPLGAQFFPNVTAVSLLPAIAGSVPQVPFEHVAGHIFTDWSGEAAEYNADIYYSKNDVVAFAGSHYRSLIDVQTSSPSGDPLTWDGNAESDPSFAVLVYTAKITDATLFPALFYDAVAAELATELALTLANEPQLARALKDEARLAVNIALAAEGNGRQADVRADSSFIAGRG